jgi:hypothetical protein
MRFRGEHKARKLLRLLANGAEPDATIRARARQIIRRLDPAQVEALLDEAILVAGNTSATQANRLAALNLIGETLR